MRTWFLLPSLLALALPPAAAPQDLVQWAEGRVIDGRNGLPVEGAQVEFWTEEISRAGQGLRPVGSARTARDGQFRARKRVGGLLAEKLRVRRAGYLTFLGTVGDAELVRLVPMGNPIEVRLVDLEDRPIEGARLTSTYSCSHDVPGFEVVTDASGRARLLEYGRQDHEGEVRVQAPGYGAIEYLDLDELVTADRAPKVLRLPRRSSFSGRCLDREGRPLEGIPLHLIEGDGYHVPVTDERGRFEVDAPYDGRDAVLEWLRLDRRRHFYSGPFPTGRTMNLRLDSERLPEGEPLGTLRVRSAIPDLEATLWHEDGWTSSLRFDEPELEVLFPPGDAWILVGAPFRGFVEELVPLKLGTDEPLSIELAPRPEPRLILHFPPGEVERLTVQAGAESTRIEVEGDTAVLTVPPDRPLVIISEGSTPRRLRHPGIDGGLTGDLELDLARAEALPPDPPTVETVLEIALFGRGTRLLQGPELRLLGPGSVERLGDQRFRLTVPTGIPIGLIARAEGHAELHTELLLRDLSRPDEISFPLTPLAALDLTLPEGTRVRGPLATRLDRLHPGPLTLTLDHADGRSTLLELDLAPGERRRMEIER